MQRRLAAILAADVVGYSRLMGEDEAGTLGALKSLRKDLVAPQIAQHKGRVVKLMGDGLLAEFTSVVEAVACAVAIQTGMPERNDGLTPERRIVLRIGINLGDVIVEGSDIYGDGVNVAARLEGLADPGGICISDTVYQSVRAKLDLAFDDMGDQPVKNIAVPVHAYRVLLDPSIAPSGSLGGPSLPLPSRPSVAVLPFNNMSGDAEQEYFADGITEDIITELARNRGLFVIARNSSFAFKGAVVDIADMGRRLGVRYVVEGSVRKAGNRVRITAQLIEAATGSHVWAERYDRDLEDIFEVQDEVTRNIATAVPDHLESDIVKASRRKPTESLDAYDHFLRGKQLMNGWRDEDIPQAIAAFEHAVKLDPMFARAHACMGNMHLRNWWRMEVPQDLEAAAKETELGVRLDGEDSDCLGWRGHVLVFQRDFDSAFETLQRALQLNADDPDLGVIMACCLAYSGQADDAIERVRRAMRANPIFPSWYHEVGGIVFMAARQYEDAVKSFQAIRDPAHYIHVWAAGCLVKLGRLDEARPHSRMASKLRPDWGTGDWRSEFKTSEDIEHECELARLALEALQHEV